VDHCGSPCFVCGNLTGRNDLLVVQDGWDEIARSIEKWLEKEASK
jgi:hypothetical protein